MTAIFRAIVMLATAGSLTFPATPPPIPREVDDDRRPAARRRHPHSRTFRTAVHHRRPRVLSHRRRSGLGPSRTADQSQLRDHPRRPQAARRRDHHRRQAAAARPPRPDHAGRRLGQLHPRLLRSQRAPLHLLHHPPGHHPRQQPASRRPRHAGRGRFRRDLDLPRRRQVHLQIRHRAAGEFRPDQNPLPRAGCAPSATPPSPSAP